MTQRKYILGALLLLVSMTTYAKVSDIHFGIGNLSQNYDHVQETESGDMNGFETRPYLILGFTYDFSGDVDLYPEFGITPPYHGEDEKIDKLTFFFSLPAGYRAGDFLFLLGPGFIMTRITSDGGTERLNNGTGYDDFYLPYESSTSRNFMLTGGVQFFYTDWGSTKLGFQVLNMTNSLSRVYNFTLSFNLHLGPWDELIN